MIVKDKRYLVIVAHQDDESLYFGGLLSSIVSPMKIVTITAPALNRPDTDTRIDSFKKVCNILKCEYSLYGIKDNDSTSIMDITSIIKHEIKTYNPDTIITHNPLGEPNKVYSGGHMMHKIISEAVISTNHQDLILSGIGYEYNEILEYDVNKKKELIDCYLPNWSPENAGYDFVYKPEPYKIYVKI